MSAETEDLAAASATESRKQQKSLETSGFSFLSALASGNLPVDEMQAEAGYHSSLRNATYSGWTLCPLQYRRDLGSIGNDLGPTKRHLCGYADENQNI